MSIFTSLALPTTLTDLLLVRTAALRHLDDARRSTKAAQELLDQHGRYLMPHSAKLREPESRVIAELDASLWRRAFDLTGFSQLMDAEAVAEFERSLSPKPPEFIEGNIRSTFIDLKNQADFLFRRGIVNVFRYLSDAYKTNAREPFRVGRKIIIGYMIEPAFGGGMRVRIGNGGDKLNDIDRVMATLGGKQFKPRELESAMNAAFKAGDIYEDDAYRAKAFKNGNLHLEFKRQDLLDKLNEQIAEHYHESVIPDGRKAR